MIHEKQNIIQVCFSFVLDRVFLKMKIERR